MPNDFNDLDTAAAVRQYLGDQTRAEVGASVGAAAGTNGDLEAELRRVSEKTGVPISSARAMPDDVKRRAAVGDVLDAVQRYPSTMRFLADGDNARIAHDDIDALTAIEGAFRRHGELKSWEGPAPSFGSVASGIAGSLGQGARLVREGLRMQFGEAFGFDTSDAQRRYEQEQSRVFASTPTFESATAGGLYGGATSLVRQIPGIAASILSRSSAPMLAAAGVQTEAEAYGKYRARGATGLQAFTGAVGEGAVEVGTEMIPMGFMVSRFGKVGAGEFLRGLLGRELPTEQIATVLQDAIDTAVANPEKTWGEYLRERPGAAYQTALATAVQSGAMGVAHTVAARAVVQEASTARSGEMLAELMPAAGGSRLLQRRDGL